MKSQNKRSKRHRRARHKMSAKERVYDCKQFIAMIVNKSLKPVQYYFDDIKRKYLPIKD